MIPLLFLFLLNLLVPVIRVAASQVTPPSPATSLGWSVETAATLPTLGQALPDPSNYSVVGWLIVGIVAIIALIGTVLGVIISVFVIIDRIRGKVQVEQPVMTEIGKQVIVKQSDDGPNRVEF